MTQSHVRITSQLGYSLEHVVYQIHAITLQRGRGYIHLWQLTHWNSWVLFERRESRAQTWSNLLLKSQAKHKRCSVTSYLQNWHLRLWDSLRTKPPASWRGQKDPRTTRVLHIHWPLFLLLSPLYVSAAFNQTKQSNSSHISLRRKSPSWPGQRLARVSSDCGP